MAFGSHFCDKLTEGQGTWDPKKKGWDQVEAGDRMPVQEGAGPGHAELTLSYQLKRHPASVRQVWSAVGQ